MIGLIRMLSTTIAWLFNYALQAGHDREDTTFSIICQNSPFLKWIYCRSCVEITILCIIHTKELTIWIKRLNYSWIILPRDTNDLDNLKKSNAANLERSQLTYKQCMYMLSGWDKFCLKYPGQICNVVFGHNYSSYYACNIPLRFTYVLWGGNWISFLPCVYANNQS